MRSFVDESPEERGGFLRQKKRYRDAPVDVFNDALLSSLRQSQAFVQVDRNQSEPAEGYILTGELLGVETKQSTFGFALFPSTMRIEAVFVTRYRLEDTKTGSVLLDETITGIGDGSVHAYAGGVRHTTAVDPSGQVGQSVGRDSTTYDSTRGYEASISQAISDNARVISEQILNTLQERAAATRAEPSGSADAAEVEIPAVGAPPARTRVDETSPQGSRGP